MVLSGYDFSVETIADFQRIVDKIADISRSQLSKKIGNADRIEACLAIDLLVAWSIYHLTKLGREVPDLPCTVFFEDSEWKALVAFKTENPIPPEKPHHLKWLYE